MTNIIKFPDHIKCDIQPIRVMNICSDDLHWCMLICEGHKKVLINTWVNNVFLILKNRIGIKKLFVHTYEHIRQYIRTM